MTEEKSIAPLESGGFAPRSMVEALEFAKELANSDMIPKDYLGKPGNILVAIQWGSELGLKPLQALQSISSINGRPSLWGDAALALVLASPVCDYVRETWDAHGTAVCKAKRKGQEEVVREFSDEDARKANLTGKTGPWTQYPKRMRQLRARAFALRDVFPDVLRGMPIREEVMDYDTTLPQTATSIAESARPAIEHDSPQRKALVDTLEGVATADGVAGLQTAWKALKKEERHLVGAETWERIKGMAKPAEVVDERAGD